MRAKRLLRSSWVVTVGASAMVGACSKSPAPARNPVDCPAAEPILQTPCTLPVDDQCTYGDGIGPCGSPIVYLCSNGEWTGAWPGTSGNPPRCGPTAAAMTPASGSPCNSCAVRVSPCRYQDPACGFRLNVLATCSHGQWSISVSPCDVPDSGLSDGNVPVPDTGTRETGTDDAATDAAPD